MHRPPPKPRQPPLVDPEEYGYGPRPPRNDSAATPAHLDLPERSPWPLVFGGFLAALVVVALTTIVVLAFDDEPATTVATPPTAPAPGSNVDLEGERLDVQGVLAEVQASVVTIVTNQETFRGLFEGAGSGVVVSADGLVLTNAHVIADADEIEVTFFDGTVAPGELVGSFPDADLAVIRAEGVTNTTPATLGSAETLKVGDEVVAIGNALNLGDTPTVTKGIVSAKGREVEAGLIQLAQLIQTDAAINPGNSGGPLVNAVGEVVGINTAIIDNAQNIGFAISIDAVLPLIDDLISGEGAITPDTAFLGASTTPLDELDEATLEDNGVTVAEGLFVADVLSSSAAAAAGLQIGDVITAIDEVPMEDSEDVARLIRDHVPGDTVVVTIARGADTVGLEVVLGSRADAED